MSASTLWGRLFADRSVPPEVWVLPAGEMTEVCGAASVTARAQSRPLGSAQVSHTDHSERRGLGWVRPHATQADPRGSPAHVAAPMHRASLPVLADTMIESIQGLSVVPYQSCANAKVGLSEHLYMQIAVLQAHASEKLCVLLLSPRAADDDVQAVVELVQRQGWRWPTSGPQAWRCSSNIIMAVAQGHVQAEKVAQVANLRANKRSSALWDTFVGTVRWGYRNDASDIHYVVRLHEPTSYVAFSIEGKFKRPAQFSELATETLSQMLGTAWQMSEHGVGAKLQLFEDQQARLEVSLADSEIKAQLRLRWSGAPFDGGLVVTCRIQRLGEASRVNTLEAAGYLPCQVRQLEQALLTDGGCITLSGVVNSGKSQTLSLLVKALYDHRPDFKILTLEDPVEITMANPNVFQRSLPRDLLQSGPDPVFAAASRSLLRSALHGFLMGEVRDRETAQVVRTMFESGHLTLTTLHARDALGIVDRYVSPEIGLPLDVLGVPGNLKLNVYQALVACNCRHCALPQAGRLDLLRGQHAALQRHHALVGGLVSRFGLSAETLRWRNPEGCVHCRRPDMPELQGSAGRTVVAEMVQPDEELCGLILRGEKVLLRQAWRARSDGRFDGRNLEGKTAAECAVVKVGMGLLDPEEVDRRFGLQTLGARHV